MIGPFFWKLLAAACILWYSTITIYVALRGARDIREMLRRLKENRSSVTNDGTEGPR
jgi:hypothetical protein